MKKILVLLILCLPVTMIAQGIYFEEGLNWEQVKAKANRENKYIFVDCYATWCGPCKMMDKNIYSRDTVGNYMNEKFISVKVQMDSSKNDDPATTQWYADAEKISKDFSITAFPSFLVFAPDGNPLYKSIGASNTPKAFIEKISKSFDPAEQYYVLLEKNKEGKLDWHGVKQLVAAAEKSGDKDKSLVIAANYIHQYLERLSDEEFCTKDNLSFISARGSIITSKDRFFRLCLSQPVKIDTAVRVGYSAAIVQFIINKEEIQPLVQEAEVKNAEPQWKAMTKAVHLKYPSIDISETILKTKTNWYKKKKDWKNYTKYLVQSTDKAAKTVMPGIGAIMLLNNNAFAVFNYSNNKTEMEHAIVWVDSALVMAPDISYGMMDTKANLLYKLGRKKEAIELETKAVVLFPGYASVLEKMKTNLPTWKQE